MKNRCRVVFLSLGQGGPWSAISAGTIAYPHGLSNNIDTKAKCRHRNKLTLRQVFIRVYRLKIQLVNSHVVIFDPALWIVAPLRFSLVQISPHTRILCVRGWVWGSGPQTDKHLPEVPVNFLDDDILRCLLWVLSFYAYTCPCVRLFPLLRHI